jgi:hypothetical protein
MLVPSTARSARAATPVAGKVDRDWKNREEYDKDDGSVVDG